jgi:aerobic carbon-monoxide dehydrogenase small subunit
MAETLTGAVVAPAPPMPPAPAPAPAGPVGLDAPEGYPLVVNGVERRVVGSQPGESVLFVLRERLGLAGAKEACEQGECGACSVVLDGTLVCSCLVLAATAAGCSLRTVEALSGPGEAPSIVQQAFLDAGAVQCGFCTPGLIVAVHDLVERRPDATEAEVREAISGNLCRCTGYGRVLDAIERAYRATAAAAAEEGGR